jgi:hypothetical protein
MLEWFENVAGTAYAPALMWTALALLALLVVLLAIRVFRSLTSGTFVAGGRNRRARLAVVDATAVDNQRRLVLVRRDDVEHLILIGGSNDLVVEREIRSGEQAAEAPAPTAERPVPAPEPRIEPAERPRPAATEARVVPMPTPVQRAEPRLEPEIRPAAAAPAPAPAVTEAPRATLASATPTHAPEVSAEATPDKPRQTPEAATSHQATASMEPRVAPVAAGAAAAGTIAEAQPTPPDPAPKPSESDLDNALLQELEQTLDEERPTTSAKRSDPELDDEMERLLGELSDDRR